MYFHKIISISTFTLLAYFKDILLYHVVRAYTLLGILDSYLYASNNKDEWEIDRQLLEAGEPLTYVCYCIRLFKY